MRQPAAHELVFAELEVVQRQPKRVSEPVKATQIRVLGHHMDLLHRSVVVMLELLEVRLPEPACFCFEGDGHRWAEHCEALVESDGFLLVHPQQGPFHQLARVSGVALRLRIGIEGLVDGLLQLAQRRGDEQVAAPAVGWQLLEEVIQQRCGCGPSALGHAR